MDGFFLVLILPLSLVDELGMGHVWFCRLLCPAGTLEAGLFNLVLKPELRTLISELFLSKLALLLAVLFLCWLSFRFFCLCLCPLGAFYGFFNRISLFRLKWEARDCLDCRVCEKICPQGLKLPEELNSAECIRCLNCLKVCPISGIQLICTFPSTTRFDSSQDSDKPNTVSS
jgi:polyferredoxin